DKGYLVEGDIILTPQNLISKPTSPSLIIANEEQYRTNYLVNASKHPTITVALSFGTTTSGGLLGTGLLGTTSNTPSAHQEVFSAAVDEAIARYNAESLTIKFQRVSSNAKITVVAYSENSNTLASAGFPNSFGDPYNQIKVNTYPFSTSTTTTNINFIGT
ncbi:MAG: M57 family metalloprotease, partial [Chitinophagaceae bacterium]